MSADSVQSDYQMNSVFDWIERPLSTAEGSLADQQRRHKGQRPQPRGRQPHIPRNPPLPLQQRSPSVFDPRAGGGRHVDHAGSTLTLFSCEPQMARMSPTKRLVTAENTYRLDPPSVFKPGDVRPVMEDILHVALHDKSYDAKQAAHLCKVLADSIKCHVRKLDLPRYKFISDVTIGQIQGQGVIAASRCLWDGSRDNYTSASFQNKSLFAVATLYALNYE